MKIAILYVWMILSIFLLAMIISPYILSENTLLSAGGFFQFYPHDPVSCPLCGMTRAFIAISHGRLAEATTYNDWSVALYAILLANEFFAAIFLFTRMQKNSFHIVQKSVSNFTHQYKRS